MFKGGVETQEYFSVEMAKTFMQEGFEIYWYDLVLQRESANILKEYVKIHNKDTFVAFTFNFNGIAGEDGLYDKENCEDNFWNQAGIHVYNMVVDHPLYYHKYVKFLPEKYTQICIDKNHVKYMKKYFKEINLIKEDGFIPLGGTNFNENRSKILHADYLPMSERPINILFTGNYTPQNKLEMYLENVDKEYKEFYHSIIDELIMHPDSLVEDVARRKIIDEIENVNEEDISMCMPQMMFVDLSVRFFFRAKVIALLADSGFKIHICGAGWDTLKCHHPENIISIGNVNSSKCLEMISQAKISVNVMPWFKDGAHDRVFNSMLNGAVCLTDKSNYLTEEFKDKEEIVFYSLDNIEEIPHIVNNLLGNEEKMQYIADSGFKISTKRHTWRQRAIKISRYILENL